MFALKEWLTGRYAHMAAVLLLAAAAMPGHAAGAPIILVVTATTEKDNGVVNPAFTPESFQLSLTPDLTAITGQPPQTMNGVTLAITTFGPPTLSQTPFTASLLALNNQGALSDLSQSIGANIFFANNGSSVQSSTFEKLLVDTATGTTFQYALDIFARVNGTLHSPADVVQPDAQSLIDVLDHADTIDFTEFATLSGSTSIEFQGTATVVPEPASLALFGVALALLGLLRRWHT